MCFGEAPGSNPSLPDAANFEDHRVIRIRTGMGGKVLVFFEPGEIGPVSHGEYLGEKAAKGMEANPALDGLAVENHPVSHLMTEVTGSLAADHFGYDGAAFVLRRFFVCFRHPEPPLKESTDG